jgi:Lrp/AsnC family transcriptional regulator, leucine-responsive regulatory protein
MMDEKDKKILALLMGDGRKSMIEISSELEIPRATGQERLKKLIDAGVIRKFAAIPDYSKIGKAVTAYVFVSFASSKNISQRKLAEEISKMPGVYEVSVISGEWDILLKVRAASVQEIGSLVVDKLRMIEGIDRTETCIAFQTIKESY